MLTAVRSQCLLAKTFMMIYAASSFIQKIHGCVYKTVVGCCLTTNHVKGVVGGKKKEVVESPGSKLLLAGGCGLRVLATHSAKNRTQRGPTNLCVIDCRPSMEDSSSPDKFATCGLAHEVRPVARRLSRGGRNRPTLTRPLSLRDPSPRLLVYPVCEPQYTCPVITLVYPVLNT